MRHVCCALLAVVLFSSGLWAQAVSTAQITGTVKDQSGAVLPGAEVTVTQTDTGVSRNVVSDETGSYTLPNLPIGPYKLEVSLPGFRTYVQTGIVLQVNSNPSIHVVLGIGQVTETVEVQASATMVETQSTGVGRVVDAEHIEQMPLNGRRITDLIFLVGAAVSTPPADLNSAKNYPNPALVSVAGGLANGMTYLLDGGTHNDPFNNLNLPMPFPDAIQEFKVETSALPAQYGHHSAAAVNAVTKSGTNDLHGNVFEFVRNYLFNARNSFAPERDSLKRNQFGGTAGGPIAKNKLFFFGGYQGTIQRSNPGKSTANIPTPAMLQGDFTGIASAACNAGRPITLRAPFVNNRIDPALLSKPALKMTSYFPTPPDTLCGQITFGGLDNLNEHTYLYKVDYQRTSNDSIFFRHYIADAYLPSPYNNNNPLTLTLSGADDLANSGVLGDTHVFGPGTINSFRATFNRVGITKFQVPIFTPADLGIKITPLIPNHIRVAAGTFQSISVFGYPSKVPTASYQLSNDLSLVRGRHQIGIGVNYIRSIQNMYNLLDTSGSFTFSSQQTGLILSDFFTGQPSTYAQANIAQDHARMRYFGLYVQDSWKATPRLTVSAGLRWEPFTGVKKLRNELVHFDQAAFDAGVRSKLYVNAPAGLQFPGDPGFDTGGKTNHTDWMNFAPRLGVVLDPKGDGRMTVRASWGMFYDLPHTLFFYAYSTAPPWGYRIQLTNPEGGFTDPWKDYPGGDPFPTRLTSDIKFPAGGVFATNNFDLKTTYLEQWNLTVQKQIGQNWLASASYLGNNSIHLWTNTDINAAAYLGTGPCTINGISYPTCSTTANTQQRRRLSLQKASEGQYYAQLPQLDDGGTGTYNAMLLSVQHRLTRGLTLSSNYTWSHCISDLVTSEFRNNLYQDPTNRAYDRSNCTGTDRRHLFNFSTVVSMPTFSNQWVQKVAGNWRLSPIFRTQSGPYLSITSGVDTALNGIAGQRVDQLVAQPKAENPTLDQFFVPNAFAQPANGKFGNMGAANIQGRGSFQFDFALSRDFPIREGQRLEFRAEAYSLLNHPILGQPNQTMVNVPTNINFNTTNFGKTTFSTGERIMQFALKYQF